MTSHHTFCIGGPTKSPKWRHISPSASEDQPTPPTLSVQDDVRPHLLHRRTNQPPNSLLTTSPKSCNPLWVRKVTLLLYSQLIIFMHNIGIGSENLWVRHHTTTYSKEFSFWRKRIRFIPWGLFGVEKWKLSFYYKCHGQSKVTGYADAALTQKYQGKNKCTPP